MPPPAKGRPRRPGPTGRSSASFSAAATVRTLCEKLRPTSQAKKEMSYEYSRRQLVGECCVGGLPLSVLSSLPSSIFHPSSGLGGTPVHPLNTCSASNGIRRCWSRNLALIYFASTLLTSTTMAAYLNHQQVPLATAIPVPEAAGEYSLSRKSTDVDESQIKALKAQGYTRGENVPMDTWNRCFFLVLFSAHCFCLFVTCSVL